MKVYMTHGLMIAGTVAGMFGMSLLGDNPARALSPRDEMQVAQTYTNDSQSLGTLRQSEIQALQGRADDSSAVPAAMPGAWADMDASVQPVHVGQVSYVTGGIGDEERTALEAMRKDYNLWVMSSAKDGTRSGVFAGDTHIVIKDKQGVSLIDAGAGPLFYANLPAGTYTVEASNEGQFKKQTITVGNSKTSRITFAWQ